MAVAIPKFEIDPGELGLTEFRSLGLELLSDRLKEDRKYHILDLGHAQGPNVDFFSRVSCRICVEDLYDAWASLPPRAEDDEPLSPRVVDELLTHDRDARFDVIMGWDLFDYLDDEFIALLTKHIKRHCANGALLFMLTSTRREIPAIPARIVISGEAMLRYEPRSSAVMDNPNHTPLAFEKMMSGFHLLHSFMLQNGMQEYVFSSS